MPGFCDNNEELELGEDGVGDVDVAIDNNVMSNMCGVNTNSGGRTPLYSCQLSIVGCRHRLLLF